MAKVNRRNFPQRGAMEAAADLLEAKEDPSPAVSVEAAQALYPLGFESEAREILGRQLTSDNLWAALYAADAARNLKIKDKTIQRKNKQAKKGPARSGEERAEIGG